MKDTGREIRECLMECVNLNISVAFPDMVGAQAFTDYPHVAIQNDWEDEAVLERLYGAIEKRKNQIKNAERREFYKLLTNSDDKPEDGADLNTAKEKLAAVMVAAQGEGTTSERLEEINKIIGG